MRLRTLLLALLLAPLSFAAAPAGAPPVAAPFQDEEPPATLAWALERAAQLLGLGDVERARDQVRRALERDAKSIAAWDLRARCAEAAEDPEELAYCRYRLVQLARSQGRPQRELEERRAALAAVDPRALELLSLAEVFVEELLPLAEKYEQEGRRHSAIRVHKELLAIDPERQASLDAIERLASAPDPSLAADAKPKDLLEGVDKAWIEEHDAEHAEWSDRAKLERDNYVTHTNAGYEVLVRAAEAMEQMNAFYRQFFQYGTEEHSGSVSRIDLHIFATRDEYLELGQGPPVEWSAGHFVGYAVETYVGDGGFEEMTGTLFHEAAHQFVSLATNAAGWLNEGLASFFEGCRILANGTVIMNLPANNRLFPLAQRMEEGWMSGPDDGIESDDANATPRTAPTFRIVLENRYQWGPPWYAPTWGVVYFLYNYQDLVDGRYVYRAAFQEFIDKSGGRMGEGAVENFEEVVLENPSPPTKGVEYPDGGEPALPETVEELDEVWKAYILALRDEQSGALEVARPWLEWARYALRRDDLDVAKEHFEKGLLATPDDPELLEAFAEFLHEEREESDRAAKLQVQALRVLERASPPDADRIERGSRQLREYDPRRRDLDEVHEELFGAATALVQRYLADEQYLMAMQLARDLGGQLGVPGMDELYGVALERGGRTIDIWQLAYNERDLRGWTTISNDVWKADGEQLRVAFGEYQPDLYDFRFLTFDEITSGDFSFESEVRVASGEGAFAGLVFGRKTDKIFHAYMVFPPRPGAAEGAPAGYVDLTTFYGGTAFDVWRHTAVQGSGPRTGTRAGGGWHTLRVDVVGATVDVWFDGEFVATQAFGTRDVLRGTFGLITGPGEAAFRNVRYLSRDPDDRAAQIEREQRMAELAASGKGLNGSYLGFVPPFPEVQRWLQEPARSWDDFGVAPVVLALWSIHQNDLMPIDGWLADLHARYGDLGLRFVSVCAPDDATAIDAYLQDHAFPGSVGVDARQGFGIGESFEAFSIDRFNLPRLLLLDLDHQVVWEGDPGFSIGQDWTPGVESFLDAPLAKLIEERRLRELGPWRRAWREDVQPALAEGRLRDALEQLELAQEFDASVDPDVFDAQARLAAVRAAAASLEATGEALSRSGAEPALAVLIDWARELDAAPSARKLKELRRFTEDSANAKAWERAQRVLDALPRDLARDRKTIEDAAAELRLLDGVLPGRLADRLLALPGESPAAEVEALSEKVYTVPAAWLAQEYFAW